MPLRHVVAALLLVGTSGLLSAQQAAPAAFPQAAAQATDGLAAPRTDSLVTVLRAQVETMREYQSQLLSTVHWSLGGIITAALVLVGAGWFANFRIYNRDRDVLTNEIRATTAAELTNARQALIAAQSQSEQRVRDIVESKIAVVRDSLAREIRERRREIADLELRFLRLDMARWAGHKIHDNVITTASEAVRLALQHTPLPQYIVPEFLDAILTAFQDGAKPDSNTARNLVGMLNELPTEYSATAEAIRLALTSAQARPTS